MKGGMALVGSPTMMLRNIDALGGLIVRLDDRGSIFSVCFSLSGRAQICALMANR